jgi:hypothetical protein
MRHWFFGRRPTIRHDSLVDVLRRNADRPTDAPAVRMPTPAETHRRPIGTTAPLRPVKQGPN